MKKIIKYILSIAVIVAFTACQEDLEIGGTATEAMSGDWWVQMGVSDGAGGIATNYGYSELSTFNTASNSTSQMWLSDHGTFWDYQVKVNINLENMTFTVTDGEDIVHDDNTTIAIGKILPGAATTPSGVAADSIYFEVEWASDPGNVYVGSGYRYTGWPEDDH